MVKLYEKLFGDIAVKKGYVSEEQVAKALEIQRKEVMANLKFWKCLSQVKPCFHPSGLKLSNQSYHTGISN
jgi:hypothetical protein